MLNIVENVLTFLILLLPLTIDTMSNVAMVGDDSQLPCNISGEHRDDTIILIIWFRNDSVKPIYTVDARSSDLDHAIHSVDSSVASRVRFILDFPISYLEIKSIVPEDEAEYRCRIDYRISRTIYRSTSLHVKVPMKKLIIKVGRNNVINEIVGPLEEGSPIDLVCEVSGGNPSPRVTWWRGSQLIDDSYSLVPTSFIPSSPASSDSSILSSPKVIVQNTITIVPIRDDMISFLTCQASNSNETSSMLKKTIQIDVNLKPNKVHILNKPENVRANKLLELICQTSGSKPTGSIRWHKGDQTLQLTNENISEDGYLTTSFLSFIPSMEDDSRELICSAFNPKIPSFTLNDSLILNVHYIPVLSLVLGANTQRYGILEESDVLFECNVKANPMVDDLGWKLNGKPLMANKSGNILVRNDSVLIKNVQKQNEGRYECWATNVAGKGESEPIDLNVQYAPVCVSKSNQKIYAAAIGERIKVPCDIDANPDDVKFHWALKSTASEKILTISTESPQSHESFELTDFTENGFSSTLNYIPKKFSDYGELICWAVNSVGNQREPCKYVITSAEKPGPPQNCTVANITMDSFTISCQPGYNGGLPLNYFLELYQDDGENNIKYNQSAENYPFFVLKSLASGNAYLIKVYAVNTKGRSDYYLLRASTQFQALWHADIIEDDTVPPALAGLIVILGTFILVGCLAVHRLRKKSELIKACNQNMKMRMLDGRQPVTENGEEFYNLDGFKSGMQYNNIKNFCVNHVNLCDLNEDYFTSQNTMNMAKNGEDRSNGLESFPSLLSRNHSFDENDASREINQTQNLMNTTIVCDCCPESPYLNGEPRTNLSER